jgi:crotonobetainyl-CoA:carnitine CoA-transferase CaiB-like acyl-CoA transferase
VATGALDRIFELTPGGPPSLIPFSGDHAEGISPFAVAKAATLATASAHVAAHQLGADRGLNQPVPKINRDHALASFSGFVNLNGEPLPKWAPLSGTYPTADGRFVQIHCNFAHHAQGVIDLLGCDEERADVAAAIKAWESDAFETAMVERGMIGAKYRTMAEWEAHPHALATRDLPLITVERIGDADPRKLPNPADRALDGVRVLDCSRVLAGPVAGQTMAAHGADVLRIGAQHLPSIDVGVMGTGFGKRNAFVNLATNDGKSTFTDLVSGADVFVDAYRPGALESKGFGAAEVADVSPGVIVVQICAFDWVGPWANRRGFDSIIQTTTGLADEAARVVGSPTPVHLPVQALDYATGFLASHAAMRLLTHQQTEGGSWLARLSLLRTRNWLVDLFTQTAVGALADVPSPGNWLHTVRSPFGAITAPATMHGRWDLVPSKLGSSNPEFSS